MIADDDLALGIIEESKEINLVPLVSVALPENHKERKKVKPDWEALVLVSKTNSPVELLALPSGSRPNRHVGSFIVLNDDGLVSMQIDFSQVYTSLLTMYPNLNIEGACITERYFQLFQRGNGLDSKNAIINLDLEGVLKDIRTTQALTEQRILDSREYVLGEIAGIPLSFTDVCFVNQDETWFLAVAEGGASTYDDGAFVGAILGYINNVGEVKETFKLDIKFKPEGLNVEMSDKYERIIHIVTDADSSETPAVLYRGVVVVHRANHLTSD